jgi:hypothetical protein
VPDDRVAILRGAFKKAFNDPLLPKEWTKFTGEEMFPLMPEEQTEAIRSVPRDSETVEDFKRIAGGGPLPPR